MFRSQPPAAGSTAATTTHMLDQLAAIGIVERERSESDRRVVVSQLTVHGKELLATAAAIR